jgi:outer membrane protein assembly factor BamB
MNRMDWLRGLAIGCALTIVACGGHAVGASNAAGTSSPGPAGVAVATPSGDWREFDYNPQRTGAGPAATGITAGNLSRLSLRRVQIDGIADSSAIELHAITVGGAKHDLIAVTTSYGKTIAIDARTGAKLWEYDPSGVNATPGNPQVTTSSPVVDPDRRYLYSASPNGFIHKLSIATGRQLWSRRITFDPVHEKIASALNVSGSWVVAVTGGYDGDIPPYDGHVVTIDRTSGRIDHVWNTECAGRHRLILASSCSVTNTNGDNAIWGRAGAVIEPGSGRILVATGNGPFDGSSSWGDSVLELTPDAGRLLHNWTPTNQAQLDSGDVDLGSSSPALLPTYHGLRLAVQGGKDGKLHLLDLDRLDGTRAGPSAHLGGELGEASAPGGGQVLTAPAVWRQAGRVYLFVANDSGSAGYELVGGRHPRLSVVWQNAVHGTSPVVAGGLLYIYDETDGALVIRQPVSGVALRSLPVADGHWDSPIVVGGRVILPTGSYHDSSATSTIEIYHVPGR